MYAPEIGFPLESKAWAAPGWPPPVVPVDPQLMPLSVR